MMSCSGRMVESSRMNHRLTWVSGKLENLKFSMGFPVAWKSVQPKIDESLHVNRADILQNIILCVDGGGLGSGNRKKEPGSSGASW